MYPIFMHIYNKSVFARDSNRFLRSISRFEAEASHQRSSIHVLKYCLHRDLQSPQPTTYWHGFQWAAKRLFELFATMQEDYKGWARGGRITSCNSKLTRNRNFTVQNHQFGSQKSLAKHDWNIIEKNLSLWIRVSKFCQFLSSVAIGYDAYACIWISVRDRSRNVDRADVNACKYLILAQLSPDNYQTICKHEEISAIARSPQIHMLFEFCWCSAHVSLLRSCPRRRSKSYDDINTSLGVPNELGL